MLPCRPDAEISGASSCQICLRGQRPFPAGFMDFERIFGAAVEESGHLQTADVRWVRGGGQM